MASCFIMMNVNDLISQKERERKRNETCSMNNKFEAKQTRSLQKTYKRENFKHVVSLPSQFQFRHQSNRKAQKLRTYKQSN